MSALMSNLGKGVTQQILLRSLHCRQRDMVIK